MERINGLSFRSVLTILFIMYFACISFADSGIEVLGVQPQSGSLSEPDIGLPKFGIYILFFPKDESTSDSVFPLDISSASVSLYIESDLSGYPKNIYCDRGNSDPSLPGEGGFVVEYNAIKIVYNGLFPADGEVTVTVQGVKAESGEEQDPNPYSWYFNISSVPSRDGASIALVLDRSGSMGEPADWSNPELSKMTVLKKAVAMFFESIQWYSISSDKLGVVFFEDDADPQFITGADPITDPIFVNLQDETQMNEIKEMILDASPGASTSMGDGLVAARDKGFIREEEANPNPVKAVILFSDGHQNTAQFINEENLDSKLCISPGQFDESCTNYDNSNSIKVFTVTTGLDGGAARYEFMSKIAARAAGYGLNFYEIFDDGTNMKEHFLSIIEHIPMGDKAEKTMYFKGNLNHGEEVTKFFVTSKRDRRFTVAISWTNFEISTLPFKLLSPETSGGTSIELEPSSFSTSGQGYSIAKFRIPIIWNNQIVPFHGDWEVVVDGTNLGVGKSTKYDISVLVDNSLISTEYGFGRWDYPGLIDQDFGTGETIPVQVKLTEGGGAHSQCSDRS